MPWIRRGGISYVTALPSNPVDGQEIYYAADATNGVIWHLRYRSGSSSSYKWEFVGGQSLSSTVNSASGESTSSGTFTDLSTSGPTVSPPIAGDYRVQISAQIASDTASSGGVSGISVSGGSAASVDDQYSIYTIAPSTNVGNTITSAQMLLTGITTGAITMRYRNRVSGTATFRYRRLVVTPVRVG